MKMKCGGTKAAEPASSAHERVLCVIEHRCRIIGSQCRIIINDPALINIAIVIGGW